MIRIFQSGWFAMTGGGLSFLGTLVMLLVPAATHLHVAAPTSAPAGLGGINFSNPEIDQLMAELRRQKESLDQREAQLKQLETRLQVERSEINEVTQHVHELQQEFDRNVTRVGEQESVNLKKLAKMYAGMTPDGAAAILRQLDDAVLVKLLVFMKEADAAVVLEQLGKQGETAAKRAAMISERLRRALGTPKKAE